MRDIIVKDSVQGDTTYQVDLYLWEEIVLHYIKLHQSDADIGTCFKIINESLHTRSKGVVIIDRVIDRLTEVNKLYSYVKDISDNRALDLLNTMNMSHIPTEFIAYLNAHAGNKCNVISFLNKLYGADFTRSNLTADVWTRMRPLADIGKMRGYSGPAELPLILFAGGHKASYGDISIGGEVVEVKGDGGRVGDGSNWCSSRKVIESFITQFSNVKQYDCIVQYEFDFGDISAPMIKYVDVSTLPPHVVDCIRTGIDQKLINDRQDAIDLIGSIQLHDYLRWRKNKWFILLKHPGKNTVPFGTAFIINAQNVSDSTLGTIDIFKMVKANNISFSPCYDVSGYKIKFLK